MFSLFIEYTGYESKAYPISSLPSVIQLTGGAILEEVVVVGSRSKDADYYVDGVRVRGQSMLKGRAAAGIRVTDNTVRGSFVENQTHFQIDVPIAYSIESDGEPIKIPLQQFDIDADYQYVTIPKLDPHAYLTATINGWSDYHILDGEANLYFENTFIGKTILNAQSFADSMTISLGRDLGIAVSRNKSTEFAKRKLIGGKRVDQRQMDIVIRNNKNEEVKIKVIDQVPVSVNQQIDVQIKDLFGGLLNEETGEIIWLNRLLPGQKFETSIAYEVKYPKREHVYVE